jgi:hypothetical protein
MSEELLAVSRISPAPAAQTDYDAICAALMHTERGRWFLDEYAKRNRSADTKLLLTAIERIEAVVGAERKKQAQQGFRTDLLEMAQAITRTRAEVAEIRTEGASAPAPARDNGHAEQPSRPRDVFAAAERIRDVTWAMRGHGFDPTTCNQLEELAGTILSASALRDPTDHRASKLSEVLQYLERRIDGLLESCTDGDSVDLDSEPDRAALAPAAGREPKHTNGFASHVAEPITEQIIESCELEAGDFDAEPASPPAAATDPGGALPAARIAVEELESGDVALAVTEITTDEVETVAVEAAALEVAEPEALAVEVSDPDREEEEASPEPRPEPSSTPPVAPARSEGPSIRAERSRPAGGAPEGPPEPEIPAQNHELEAHPGHDTPAAAVVVGGGAEPAPAASEPAPADPIAAEPVAVPAVAAAELAPSIEPLMAAADLEVPAWPPTLRPINSDQLLPRSPDLRSTAATAARLFLPDLEMRSDLPGHEAAWARPAPRAAVAPQATAAPATAAQQPATAASLPVPQADPLAGLKAMSENELIALFS